MKSALLYVFQKKKNRLEVLYISRENTGNKTILALNSE